LLDILLSLLSRSIKQKFSRSVPAALSGTSVLLATGSTDAHAYIYDVGGPRGTARLLQRLDGHRDRVYAAQFHPRDPVLATASADGVVKIWGPRDSFF
jgi:WD40 repeat protein